MNIISRLPGGEELTSESFYKTKSHVPRLEIGVQHLVTSTFCDCPVSGQADIHYIIECHTKPGDLSNKLKVSATIPPIGSQSSEQLKEMIDKVRPRTGYDLSAFTSHSFDFRALSYVCGQIACLAATGIDNDLSRDGSAKCMSIGQIWNNPNGGDIMVPPNVVFKSSEWATLACVARLAKCDTLTFLSDVLPPQESRQLQGKSLCAFLLRLQACILSAADGMGCSAHHDEAFFRGMCAMGQPSACPLGRFGTTLTVET
jgi:hypothetical protein